MGLNWNDFGARMYMGEIARWGVVDPKVDKFVTVSPYSYALNNPIIFVDHEGKEVKPTNEGAYKAIQNTLTATDKAYVKLDKNGMIDRTLINSHSSKSGNFNALKTMVNDKRTVEVTVTNEFSYKGKDGKIKTEKLNPTYSNELQEAKKLMGGQYSDKQLKEMGMEDKMKPSGTLGITLLPGGEKDKNGDGRGSANGNIVVIISSNLTEGDAARTESHESNGHAFFYILGKDPNHSDARTDGGNKPLEDQISKSVKETESNYDSTHKKKTD